jgi:ketosteroid isomerase-like protein
MKQRMKTLLLAFAFALAFTSAARGQTTSPPPESAKPLSEELALKALDLSWHQAVAGRDADALGRLLADDYRFELDARRFLTKAQEIEAVKASDALYAIDPFKLKDVTVRIEGERAIVTGILAVTPKGAEKTSRRRYFYTRTFVRRDGRWQARTSSLVTLFGEGG